jgi:hypothetical protein
MKGAEKKVNQPRVSHPEIEPCHWQNTNKKKRAAEAARPFTHPPVRLPVTAIEMVVVVAVMMARLMPMT